jgi:hypothetical protein
MPPITLKLSSITKAIENSEVRREASPLGYPLG